MHIILGTERVPFTDPVTPQPTFNKPTMPFQAVYHILVRTIANND
jgi:hypothetical protein